MKILSSEIVSEFISCVTVRFACFDGVGDDGAKISGIAPKNNPRKMSEIMTDFFINSKIFL